MLNKFLVPCLLFLTASTALAESAKTQKEPALLGGLTDEIQEIVDRYSAAGLAVAVIKDGEIIYTGNFGYRDVEGRQPVTDSTQFGIGSVIKSFSSGIIGTLEGEGRLNITDRPSKYLTSLEDSGNAANPDMKVENLLTQTSGLPYLDGSMSFFPAAEQSEIAERLRLFESTCRVGDCWQYNNLNFVLLDAVAEEITGQSKSDLLRQRLLNPIGMTGTLSSSAQFRNSPDAATGYVVVGGKNTVTAQEYLFGEQVYATSSDLARWLGVWMNDGRAGQKQVIPADYVKRAISMHALDNGAAPSADDPGIYLFGYGYAWNIKSVNGNYVVHHGGNENGFSTHVLFVPVSGFGVVAMTNQQNSILPNIVTDMVLRRMTGSDMVAAAAYPVNVGQSPPLLAASGTLFRPDESAPLDIPPDKLAGRYSAPGYGEAIIEFQDGTLTMETPLAKFTLLHRGERRFGLGTTERVPAGIRLGYFEVGFFEGVEQPNGFSFNIGAEPVIFRR